MLFFFFTKKVIQAQWSNNVITNAHKCMPSIPLRMDTADWLHGLPRAELVTGFTVFLFALFEVDM